MPELPTAIQEIYSSETANDNNNKKNYIAQF